MGNNWAILAHSRIFRTDYLSLKCMRKLFYSLLACIPLLLSCDKEKQPASLPEVFIASLVEQKFEMLKPYFPTIEFHKALEKNGATQSDTAAMNFVTASNL